MAVVKSATLRCGIIFLCLILGTWTGIYLQRYPATSAIFANVVDFAIDIKQVDLVMIKVAFMFALKLNLGTLIGGIAGIWASR